MKSTKEKLVETAKKKKVADANVEHDTKNKTGFLIIGLTLLMLICFGIYFATQDVNVGENKTDGEKFESEYESLNCDKEDKHCSIVEVDIDKENVIKYSGYNEIFKILEDGSGVIYFGFPKCPWCRNIIPVLLEAAEEVGLDTIYYLNNVEDRNIIELNEDEEIVTVKEGSANYFKLLEKLDSVSSTYTLRTEDKEIETDYKRLYFPTVLFVKDGEIIGFHEGTVSTQTDPSVELSDDQEKELKKILIENMEKTISCTGTC